jgi:hypothetical protein
MVIRFGFTLPNGICFDSTVAGKCFKKVLEENNGKYEIQKALAIGAGVGRNRNKCVSGESTTLKNQSVFGFDYIIFVDFDVSYTLSDVEKLIRSNKKIISGAYNYKDSNEIHAGYWGPAPGLLGFNFPYKKDGIKKIDRCGGGFLLVKEEVFKELPYPWFNHKMIEREIKGNLHRQETSEDFGFCLLAQENGFDLFCDTDCLLKHHKFLGTGLPQSIPQESVLKGIEFLKRVNLKGDEVQQWADIHNMLNSLVER